jgi:hypothetical protein
MEVVSLESFMKGFMEIQLLMKMSSEHFYGIIHGIILQFV